MAKTGIGKGNNPNSRKNLKEIKPGEVRNPKGRARNELCFTSIASEMLPEICPYDPQGRTWAKYLVERWMAQSVKNPAYFHELIERLEGKVVQPIGGEDGPLTLKIIVVSEHDKENIERVISGERT